MNTYAMGARVLIQVLRGQVSIYAHETNLTMRTTIGTIIRRIPLMRLDEDALQRFPYLQHAEAYEVEVDGEVIGAIGWPEVDGDDYNASDGIMYIALQTGQIPSLIQDLAPDSDP